MIRRNVRARVMVGSFTLAAVAAYALTSCSKKKEDKGDTTEETDTTTVGTVAVSDNGLAGSYPEGMNVTAFPTDQVDTTVAGTVAVDTSASLAPAKSSAGASLTQGPACESQADRFLYDLATDAYTPTTINEFDPKNACTTGSGPGQPGGAAPAGDYDPTKQTGADKIAEEQKLLAGDAENCFSDGVLHALRHSPAAQADSCYQSDFGVLNGTSCSSSEVCLVATSRAVVKGNVAKVEAGLGVMKAILCQAKKDGKDQLPEVGSTIDMAETINKVKPSDGPTFSKVEIKRVADQSDGRKVYKTTIELSDATGGDFSFNLAHSPSADGNTNYDGVMWIKTKRTQAGPAGGGGSALDQDGVDVMSVRYNRTEADGATQVKMEIRNARMASSLTPFFTADGLVDYNAGADMSNPTSQSFGGFPGEQNDYMGGIYYSMFDIDPVTSAGTLAFWNNPGASFTESARGFVFNVDYQDGVLQGCGYAGAATSRGQTGGAPTDACTIVTGIRQSAYCSADLKPNGFYTPRICWDTGANQTDNVGTLLWKQCFKQGEDGVYALDTAKTASAKGFDVIEAADAGVTVPATSDLKGIAGVRDL